MKVTIIFLISLLHSNFLFAAGMRCHVVVDSFSDTYNAVSLETNGTGTHSVYLEKGVGTAAPSSRTLLVDNLFCNQAPTEARLFDCRNNVGDYFVSVVNKQSYFDSTLNMVFSSENIYLALKSEVFDHADLGFIADMTFSNCTAH